MEYEVTKCSTKCSFFVTVQTTKSCLCIWHNSKKHDSCQLGSNKRLQSGLQHFHFAIFSRQFYFSGTIDVLEDQSGWVGISADQDGPLFCLPKTEKKRPS